MIDKTMDNGGGKNFLKLIFLLAAAYLTRDAFHHQECWLVLAIEKEER